MTTVTKSNNLMDGLLDEITRCTELLQAYKGIGTPGAFGAAMLTAELERAKKAIIDNDTVAMLRAFKALKECN